MTPAHSYNEDQRSRWNGPDGEYWAQQQVRLDRILDPITAPLISFAAPRRGSTVIDIGCGCGATTIELARAVGPNGRVFGIDLSEAMLAVARERLRDFSNAACLRGDAAILPLQNLTADLVVSRFGVMFFGDPVAAFRNIRTALIPRGRLRFACWRRVIENGWLHVPLLAAYEHVPPLPKPDPEEPGPFAFADSARVTRILTAAGFTTPAFTPLDFQLEIGRTLDEAVTQASEMGPARRALTDQPEPLRTAAIDSIRKALTRYATPTGVKLPAAVWLVAADCPA